MVLSIRGFWGLLILSSVFVSCSQKHYSGPLTVADALKSFQLDSNFNMEVYASEPLVQDPVSMTFDEKGNVYVVEMYDYPFAPLPGHERGRIKVLFDTDGDNKADSSVVFADSLSEATTVMPWKGGLIVTAAPHIWYLKDTNGDFRADIKKTLFDGFFKGNSEGQVTALRYSIDNWVYAAQLGFESHVRKSGQTDTGALSLAGADFRFRIDKDDYEPAAGAAQFGQAIDDWGHRFITANSSHIQQVVFPWRYHHRNPFMEAGDDVADISDHKQDNFQLTPAPYWRTERTKRRNEQFQQQRLDRVEYADKHFSGAAGGVLYTGDQFPDAFYGNYFTGDVSGNLVHRDVLRQSDSSPVYIAALGSREKNSEFLASTDPWFRPVNVTVGPDGFLYVIDMYRQHIETPFAIPEDLKKEMDFMNGSAYGRIYRIVPKNKSINKHNIPDAKHFNTADWTALLTHPNQAWRLQAQRMLIEQKDTSAGKPLQELFHQHPDGRIRLHAFFALEGLNMLTPELVSVALSDKDPGVREASLATAEKYPSLLPLIVQRMYDSSLKVSFQATLSAGGFDDEKVETAMAAILKKHCDNKWFRKAVLSSETYSSLPFVQWLEKHSDFFSAPDAGKKAFIKELAFIIAARNKPAEIEELVKALSRVDTVNDWVSPATEGFKKEMLNNDDEALTAKAMKIFKRISLETNSAPIKTMISELEREKSK